jgi:hypothetical protein
MATPEERMTKLQEILKMMDENISKEDFVKSFESVMTYVKNFQTKIQGECDAMMAQMDAKMASLKNGRDGVPGKDGTMGKQGIPGKDGKDGMDGKDGKNGIDGKTPDLQPIWDNLVAWKKEMEKQVKQIPEKAGGITVFGPGKTRIIRYDLSDRLDGATKTFTLGTHFGIVSVQSSSAPFGAFRETIDYNEVGKTIVFTAAVDAPSMLAAGQSLVIKVVR